MVKFLLQLASNIPAALVGGGVCVAALLVFHLGIPLVIGLSMAAYVITGLLIFPAQSALEQREQQTLKVVLKEGEHKLAALRGLCKQIPNPTARKRVETIWNVGVNILEAVKKNPETAASARQFSGYYLDATLKIVQQYRDLTAHAGYSGDAQQTVAKVEAMLGQIQQTFEQQLTLILRDKMLNLDTELAVLQETIAIDTF